MPQGSPARAGLNRDALEASVMLVTRHSGERRNDDHHFDLVFAQVFNFTGMT
jgi:hypothetical protein